MRERCLGLMPAQHSTILTPPVVIGSDAWIRTMIQGFKVLCPAFRRRRKTWGRENSKPSRIRPFSVGVSVGQRAQGLVVSCREPTERCCTGIKCRTVGADSGSAPLGDGSYSSRSTNAFAAFSARRMQSDSPTPPNAELDKNSPGNSAKRSSTRAMRAKCPTIG